MNQLESFAAVIEFAMPYEPVARPTKSSDKIESTEEFVRESRLGAMRWAAEQIRPEFSDLTWQLFWESAVMGRSIADVAEKTGRTSFH